MDYSPIEIAYRYSFLMLVLASILPAMSMYDMKLMIYAILKYPNIWILHVRKRVWNYLGDSLSSMYLLTSKMSLSSLYSKDKILHHIINLLSSKKQDLCIAMNIKC